MKGLFVIFYKQSNSWDVSVLRYLKAQGIKSALEILPDTFF